MRRPEDWLRQAELDLSAARDTRVEFHRLDHPAVMAQVRAYAVNELAPGAEVSEVVLIGSPEEAAAWSPRFRAEVEEGVVLYRRTPASTHVALDSASDRLREGVRGDLPPPLLP